MGFFVIVCNIKYSDSNFLFININNNPIVMGFSVKIRFGYNQQKFEIIILFLFHIKAIWR